MPSPRGFPQVTTFLFYLHTPTPSFRLVWIQHCPTPVLVLDCRTLPRCPLPTFPHTCLPAHFVPVLCDSGPSLVSYPVPLVHSCAWFPFHPWVAAHTYLGTPYPLPFLPSHSYSSPVRLFVFVVVFNVYVVVFDDSFIRVHLLVVLFDTFCR